MQTDKQFNTQTLALLSVFYTPPGSDNFKHNIREYNSLCDRGFNTVEPYKD